MRDLSAWREFGQSGFAEVDPVCLGCDVWPDFGRQPLSRQFNEVLEGHSIRNLQTHSTSQVSGARIGETTAPYDHGARKRHLP